MAAFLRLLIYSFIHIHPWHTTRSQYAVWQEIPRDDWWSSDDACEANKNPYHQTTMKGST